MQENTLNSNLTEEEQFKEFRKAKRIESAKGSISKIECDCLSVLTDKTELKEICKSANAMELGALVVFPTFVSACVSFLGKDPKTSLIASIAYPYGEEVTEIKAQAVKRAVKDGVDEVEVCAPTAFIKAGNFTYLKREAKKLKKSSKNCALRVVLDCAMLTEKELLKSSQTLADAGVNCLRLNGADGDTVNKVKTALKGKCLIKADGADGEGAFEGFCVMGADYVSCKRALDLASYLLKKAEEE